ncbi:hypothetical protein SRHO_G00167800 [Serrasalmus rhombeus]
MSDSTGRYCCICKPRWKIPVEVLKKDTVGLETAVHMHVHELSRFADVDASLVKFQSWVSDPLIQPQ